MNVNDGDLSRLCPVCCGDFTEDFIKNHSSAETFQKYTRFKINKQSPNMRSCSKCNTFMEGRCANSRHNSSCSLCCLPVQRADTLQLCRSLHALRELQPHLLLRSRRQSPRQELLAVGAGQHGC